MLQQVQVVRISWFLGKEQQMLIVQISLVITLVLTQQVRLFKFLGLNRYEARNANSQIWVKVLVIVQQALVKRAHENAQRHGTTFFARYALTG
jgi:hypothetical protein